MRTHIRMHFDKKSTDFNEEHYISCILEEDVLEIPPVAQMVPTESVQPQLHCCDKCNYSSSYKGNVVGILDKNIVQRENIWDAENSSETT